MHPFRQFIQIMAMNKKYGTALAIFFMLLFIGAIGAQFWASGRVYDFAGPDHIAVDADKVYVHVNGEILSFDYAGKLQSRYGKEITHLVEAPIDLRALPDGRVLIASQRPARLTICDFSRRQCDPFASPLTDKLGSQYKVWWAQEINVLFAADADSGGIYSYDIEFGSARKIPLKQRLLKPNDIAIDNNLYIWVADSGHYRIAQLAPTDNDSLEIVNSHSTRNKFSRPDQDYPMMLAQDDVGNWWVTQPKSSIGSEADVLIYDPDRGAQKRITLPANTFATDIAWVGDGMVVTDMEHFRIIHIASSTLTTSQFGDNAFYQIMDTAKEQRQHYEQLTLLGQISMAVFAVLMIGTAVLVTPKDKRWTEQPKVAEMNIEQVQTDVPPIDGLYWLKRNRKTEKMLRSMIILSFIGLALMIVGFGYAFNLTDRIMAETTNEAEVLTPDPDRKAIKNKKAKLEQASIVFAIFMAGLIPVLWLGFNGMRRRLGTDGTKIYIQYPDGKKISAMPKDIVYNNRVIAYKNILVQIQTGDRKPLYAENELERYILPLLKQAKKLNLLAMQWHHIVHRDPLSIYTFVFLGIMGILLFSTGLHREFF